MPQRGVEAVGVVTCPRSGRTGPAPDPIRGRAAPRPLWRGRGGGRARPPPSRGQALERVEEALHRRVVEARPLSAHGGRDPRRGQGLAARLAGVLDPAIGVTDQARGGALPLDRRLERLHGDLGPCGPSRARPGPRSCGCARIEDRGRGTASPHGSRTQGLPPRGRGSGRRARPRIGSGAGSGSGPPPRSGARSGWARWDGRGGCRWCAPGAAGPPGPAGRRAASAAPPGGARPAGRGPAGRHAPAARVRCPRSRRGPRGWRREAPGWLWSARSRVAPATHSARSRTRPARGT